MLDPSASPIAALLPVGLSEELRQALAHHGVVWHFGTTVQRVDHHSDAGGPLQVQVNPAPAAEPSWPNRWNDAGPPVQAKKQKLLHLPGANAPAGAAYNFAPVSTHMPALSGRVHHL